MIFDLQILKKTSILFLIILSGCTSKEKQITTTETIAPGLAKRLSEAKILTPGKHVIIQNATSDTATTLSVLAPRLKKYTYKVFIQNNNDLQPVKTFTPYKTIHYPPMLWKVDKVFLDGLQPKQKYILQVVDLFRDKEIIVDEREFQTLDLSKKTFSYSLTSCMSDDWRFTEIRNKIWQQLINKKPDFVILNGDTVYVDSFDFVEREKSTEADLWLRYIDSLMATPYFRNKTLIPTLATWDDHDFGTNDGDRRFKVKNAARDVFAAFFVGQEIKDVFEIGTQRTYSAYHVFGQSFYFMDNRTFRQPNKDQKVQELFGHWGETQHLWLIDQIKSHKNTTVVVNGNQIFNGKNLGFKEAFEANHAKHYQKLMTDLKEFANHPLYFLSGDIHFSEVVKVPKERGPGFDTFEITSSAIHSYTKGAWENEYRLPNAVTDEANFLLIQSEQIGRPTKLNLKVNAFGLHDKSYFETEISLP